MQLPLTNLLLENVSLKQKAVKFLAFSVSLYCIAFLVRLYVSKNKKEATSSVVVSME